MRLECRKIFTPKKVAFMVIVVIIVFAATSRTWTEVGTHGYNLLHKINGIISEKASQLKTMVEERFKTNSTTTIYPEEMRKATDKTLSKNSPNKTTMKIFTISPSRNSRTTNMKKLLGTAITFTIAPPQNSGTTDVKMPFQSRSIFKISPTRDSLEKHRILKTSTVNPKNTTSPKHVICFRLSGRLGNLMFKYASAYGIARSKGMGLVFYNNERLAKIFHLNPDVKFVKYISKCDRIDAVFEIRASAFDKKTVEFDNTENIALVGYLQSYKYFEKVSDEIRHQFTFRDSIKQKAENIIRDIHKKRQRKYEMTRESTFVGVHVRRKDMVYNLHGYTVAPKEYFQRAQILFRGFYQNVIFVVCSDDIKWCKNYLKSEDTYFVEGNSPEVDMATLSSCNHTISSVGSFSWWSAWLANGLVTYYSPPARPESDLRKEYSKDFNDYFPSKWIRIQLGNIHK